ncbi:hypothetical protein [Spirosoma validum]|uniref:hypothetical protein n=1 Tax=Spirosoma validum TaxID=2771355 RepID=UPI001CC2911B|nr:hypothetical protein [Spirosoma validum]
MTHLTHEGGSYDLLAFPLGTAHHPQIAILCQFGSQPLPSQQAKTQESLREADQRFRLAIEAVQMANWEWHILTDQVYWNEQHFRLFGMPPRAVP